MSYNRPIAVIGFFTTILVTLKLLGEIDWSGWGVLAPLWVPIGTAVLAVVLVILLFDPDD